MILTCSMEQQIFSMKRRRQRGENLSVELNENVVEGLRVTIHRITKDDKDFVKSMFCDPEMMTYYENGCMNEKEWADGTHMSNRFHNWIKRSDKHLPSWWIVKTKSNYKIGAVGLYLSKSTNASSMKCDQRTLEIAIMMKEKGNRLAQEAIFFLLCHHYLHDLVFGSLGGYLPSVDQCSNEKNCSYHVTNQKSCLLLIATIHPKNMASRKLFEGLGFRTSDYLPSGMEGTERLLYVTPIHHMFGFAHSYGNISTEYCRYYEVRKQQEGIVEINDYYTLINHE